MPAFQETLDLVVADVDRCFTTKRKDPGGQTEAVETSFDHALTSLKLFELTRDSKYLENWIGYIFGNAVFVEEGVRWNFSSCVTDKPPDADSTAMNLLYLTIAKKKGITLPDRYLASANLSQYKDLISESGGIETFFGLKRDVDPVVNTAVAFLYELNHISDETRKSIREYLRKQTKQLIKLSKFSKYYVTGVYFAERMAKLSIYDPAVLDRGATEVLERYLSEKKPRNTLEEALLSIGASHRGLYNRAVELNRDIERKRKQNGLWHFGTFYTQRTPRFNYGHERLTTLFALEALKLEEENFQVRKVEY